MAKHVVKLALMVGDRALLPERLKVFKSAVISEIGGQKGFEAMKVRLLL
jgi:hypothetical protein